ncbi:MAG TPA: histidine--tRNA ligase [Nitrososphaeraceae archaeon]|nr:histidine--tRNA ligase [Nitrososphaeraceae archaeon]
MKLELPRGMRDLSYEDTLYLEYIRTKFYETISYYNFQIIEPSPIELLSTLEAKSGESIINEIYNFKDKGGRDIALRYDLTIGITRFAVSKRELRIPIKLANFGGVFRYDEPQAGRYRYFHQWDIEIYDNFNSETEAEVIEFVSNFFNNIGLETIIEISDRRIIEEYIKTKYDLYDENLIGEIFRAIDKVSKKGVRQVCMEYKDILDPTILEDLLEICSFKGDISDIISHEKLKNLQSIRYLQNLFTSLELRNINNKRINLGIVRGLDYYSGIVFEVFDQISNIGSIVGGGRYDKLPKIFGRSDLGAVGAAGGVERIILALRYHNKLPQQYRKIIYIANSSESVRNQSLLILSNLRKKGFIVEYDLSNRSLRKQLYDASSKNVILTIIVAPEEISMNKVIIRNMKDGKEMIENIEDLDKKIAQFL